MVHKRKWFLLGTARRLGWWSIVCSGSAPYISYRRHASYQSRSMGEKLPCGSLPSSASASSNPDLYSQYCELLCSEVCRCQCLYLKVNLSLSVKALIPSSPSNFSVKML